MIVMSLPLKITEEDLSEAVMEAIAQNRSYSTDERVGWILYIIAKHVKGGERTKGGEFTSCQLRSIVKYRGGRGVKMVGMQGDVAIEGFDFTLAQKTLSNIGREKDMKKNIVKIYNDILINHQLSVL